MVRNSFYNLEEFFSELELIFVIVDELEFGVIWHLLLEGLRILLLFDISYILVE